MLNSINGLLVLGAIIGFVIGLLIHNFRLGCVILVLVPIAMIGYIYQWQSQHPENLRSTSGLDFLFGPIWPSIGAIGGYTIARVLRRRKS